MPLYRLNPPGELVEADSVRDEGRTVALIGTALVMNRPRDVVVRRVPASVVVEVVDDAREGTEVRTALAGAGRHRSETAPTPSDGDARGASEPC